MEEKTGMNLDGRVMIFRMKTGEDGEEEKPIDPNEIPPFSYAAIPLADVINNSLFDIGMLVIFNLIFFIGSFLAFLRYDLR